MKGRHCCARCFDDVAKFRASLPTTKNNSTLFRSFVKGSRLRLTTAEDCLLPKSGMDGCFGDTMAGSAMAPLRRRKLLHMLMTAPLLLLSAAGWGASSA